LQSRAIFRSRRNDLDGALADIDRGLRLDPSYAPSWNLRGRVKALKRDIPGAIADYERYLVLAPDASEAAGVREWIAAARRAESTAR
ncbi:MAG: tetratricopeptide repeat protein, partial [Planctomycetota bacterium]